MLDYFNCPIFFKDFYKVSHVRQYPEGTTLVFSNFTPRKSRIEGINHSVFFGLTYLIKEYLIERFNKHFFALPEEEVITMYQTMMRETLGSTEDFNHIRKLHQLGYLPIAIYALPELSVVPSKVPALVIYNIHPDFFWLPNALETIISATLWGMCTSATIAREYRRILDIFANLTSDTPEFVEWQAHDFSFRGIFGLEAAMMSGAAHLQYFKGTDSIPAISFLNKYYNAPLNCGGSVPATEHSVMCAGGQDYEFDTFKRLITEIYPTGIISIVSDSWNFWEVIDKYLPRLKHYIMKRDGKVVIRPDSGDPVDIICGTYKYCEDSEFPQTSSAKGLIESLWQIFGGTINSKGYKVLDSHIGAIYGDSITLERAREICARLKAKNFASTNIIFGVGSFSYQYNTRDTFGWAMKATYCEINGEGIEIFKDPITDDGTKKSAKGLLKVIMENGILKLKDQISWDEFHADDNQLKLVFKGTCKTQK